LILIILFDTIYFYFKQKATMSNIHRIKHTIVSGIQKTFQAISDAFTKLWQKVSGAVASVFANISCFSSGKFSFTHREITLLNNIATPRRVPPPPSLDNRNIQLVTAAPIETRVDNTTITIPEIPYVTFDPALEELRSFLKDFSVLCADHVYDESLAQKLQDAQNNASTLPSIIKSFAKLLVEVGDKAAKPIFQKFTQQKAQVIDPYLRKIFKTLLSTDPNKLEEGQTPSIEQIQKERRDLYDIMLKQLAVEFKDTKAPSRQNLQVHYIQPILNWLVLTDHTVPLEELFGPGDSQKNEIIDSLFERSIAILVEHKIDQYAHLLERTMQRQLADITHEMMRINAQRMTDFFSERIADLINSMPFTDTFDAVIHDVIFPHIEGINEAQKAVKEFKELYEEAKKIAVISPKNSQEETSQRQAKSLLETVAKYPNEEEFFRTQLIKKYSGQTVCTTNIRQLIDQEIAITLQGGNPAHARTANENAFLTTISENILDLMTPIKKRICADGTIEEIDPFIELWDRLYFPKELQEIFKHCTEMVSEFVTPETTNLFKTIKAPTIEILKTIFRSQAKDYLQKWLVQAVRVGFEKVIDPTTFNELTVDSIAPSINTKLLQVLLEQNVEYNLAKFSPFIHTMMTDDPANHESNMEKLQKEIIAHAKSSFKLFNPDSFYTAETNDGAKATLNMSPFTDEDWMNVTKSIVQEYERIISTAKIKNAPFDPANTSPTEIKDILTKYFKSASETNDPVYGEIVMSLLFKTGSFSNEGLISYFIKDTISTSLTSSILPMRADHTYLIKTMAESLKETFLDPQQIKELFSDIPPPKRVYTQQRLAHQINVTSRLAHEIIMRLSQQQGAITAFAVRRILTDTPDVIDRLITKVYKKLFRDRLLTENMMLLIYDELARSLSVSAEQIRMRDNIRILQVT
jgi:hypothetical protein